jgi:hypothetical protein
MISGTQIDHSDSNPAYFNIPLTPHLSNQLNFSMVYSPLCVCAEFVYFPGPRCEQSFSLRSLIYKMSYTARSDPIHWSLNHSSSATNVEKKVSRKDYYARRTTRLLLDYYASRVYSFENFAPGREFKTKHDLKRDACCRNAARKFRRYAILTDFVVSISLMHKF